MALNIELKSIDFILQQPKLFRYKLLVDLRQTLRRIADQNSVEAPYILIGSRRAIYLRNDLTIDNRDQLNRFGWHTSWSSRCPLEGWTAGDLQMEIYNLAPIILYVIRRWRMKTNNKASLTCNPWCQANSCCCICINFGTRIWHFVFLYSY
jgi:hypothetical protein